MSDVFIRGWGAVSPAGWGAGALGEALARGEPLPAQAVSRPGGQRQLRVRPVPSPASRPSFATHPRLRRTSPITQHAMGAALEALGSDAPGANGAGGLGIIYCAMVGCVNYSRRFYDETLKDPATASPVVFPETVFNAPASHLGAFLGATAVNYTLVGDPGTFLQGLALAAEWLTAGRVERCLVVGAEELDWMITEASWLFHRGGIVAAGAGAVCLGRKPAATPAIRLLNVTEPELFWDASTRAAAARRVRAQIDGATKGGLLCDSTQGEGRPDREEQAAWSDWCGDRISPKRICGEGFMAAAAWQCVAALEALAYGAHRRAVVSVVGSNEQAIAAEFERTPE